jgi:hypothetical protein
MILFVLAYLSGVPTIISPYILPVRSFVFARADRPFVSSGLHCLLAWLCDFCRGSHAGRGRRWLGGACQ